MTEFVDIYYSGVLCFRRIEADEVKGIIEGWIEGGRERGRRYDVSKFTTKPTEFEEGVPPIAGMSKERWNEEVKKHGREKLDLDSARRSGFFVMEGKNLGFGPGFARCLESRCKMRSGMGDEELLYRVMLSMRDFAPHLTEPDFLAARRVVLRKARVVRSIWEESHPKEEQEPVQKREERLAPLREQWATGFETGHGQDMLTLVYEMQLKNARKIIASGGNFQPELLMWRDRFLAGTMFQGPDPMTQAIALIQQAQPEGYSFAGEAWVGRLPEERSLRNHKWGDIAKLESKTEGFIQGCAENWGPLLSRTFAIDREKAVLVEGPNPGESRLPGYWRVDDVPPKWASNPTGPYA